MSKKKIKKNLPALDEKKIKELSKKFKSRQKAKSKEKSKESHKTPPKAKPPVKERFRRWWFKPEKKPVEEKKLEAKPKADKPVAKPEELELPKLKKASLAERFKRKKEARSKAEEKDETPAPAETIQKTDKKEEERARKEAKEKALKAKKARFKKPRKKLERKSLEQYLEKAGFTTPATKVKRVSFYSTLGVFLLLTALVFYKALQWGFVDTPKFLLFVGALWTVLFAGALLFGQAAVYFYLDYRIYKRTVQVEEVLPDFLQLASSNIAAGMPIDRALWYSIRPQFGVLAKEMEEVAKATMSGEDLEQSLMNFTKKYDSELLKRSITILIEGLNAGGEMADLLNKIALNIDELKIMKKEMAASVTTYAIFITFAAIVIAPFLFALATELLHIIIKITGNLDVGASGLFSFSAADPEILDNFTMFSVLMLIVTAGFSTSIVSIIRKGRVVEGIKGIPVYAGISVAIYYGSIWLLDGLFGGII